MRRNYIIDWRCFVASQAKRAPKGSSFFEDAKSCEQKTLEFSFLRIAAAKRNLKASIVKLFKDLL